MKVNMIVSFALGHKCHNVFGTQASAEISADQLFGNSPCTLLYGSDNI